MQTDVLCPICNSAPQERFPVGISPFLRERMFSSRAPRECLLLHCSRCDFHYFNIRPDEQEVARYYDGYRSGSYQRQRQQFEKTYTREYNDLIGNNPREISGRTANLENVLVSSGLDLSTDVLDYGGNDGRFIPGCIKGRKYCYDISHNATVKGVISVDSTTVSNRSYGLVMLCHVLEHVSYPKEFLAHVLSFSEKEGALYVEVPYEPGSPDVMRRKNRTVTGRLVRAIKRYRPRFLFPKNSFGISPGFHEHVNYFTPTTLASLMNSLQMEVLDIGTKTLDFGWTEGVILYCLARKIRGAAVATRDGKVGIDEPGASPIVARL